MEYKFLKESIYYSLAKALPAVLNFLFIIFIFNFFSQEEFIKTSNLIAISSVFSGLFSSFYSQSYLKFFKLEYSIFFQKLLWIFCATILILGFLSSFFLGKYWIVFTTFSITLFYISAKVVAYQKQQKPKFTIIFEILRGFLLYLVPMIFIIINNYQSFYDSLNIVFLFLVFYLAISFIIDLREINKIDEKPSQISFNKISSYALMITIWLLFSGLLNYIDRAFIYLFLTPQENANYIFWYDIIFKISLLSFVGLTMNSHTKIMQYSNESLKGFDHIKQEYFRIAVPIILTSIFLLCLYSYARNYFQFPFPDSSFLLLLLLYLGVSLWQIALLLHKPLEVKGKVKSMIFYLFCALLLNCVLNFIFIPIFGILAAAMSTVASSIIYLSFVRYKSFELLNNEK